MSASAYVRSRGVGYIRKRRDCYRNHIVSFSVRNRGVGYIRKRRDCFRNHIVGFNLHWAL